jgi:hypothetical protein
MTVDRYMDVCDDWDSYIVVDGGRQQLEDDVPEGFIWMSCDQAGKSVDNDEDNSGEISPYQAITRPGDFNGVPRLLFREVADCLIWFHFAVFLLCAEFCSIFRIQPEKIMLVVRIVLLFWGR